MKILRKEILMGFSNFIFAGFVLMGINGCADQKVNHKETVLVRFEVIASQPHCGGAAPDPSMVYPMMVPQPNQELLVFSTDLNGNRKEKIATIKTDDEGNASIQLPLGNYQLWRPDKMLILKEFTTLNTKDSNFYEYKNESCFQQWKDTPDLVFTANTETVKWVRKMKCYIGDHPCVTYNGPYAP
ncbi:MAG: hypothetical protein KJ941_06405 [Bacteroidetes bacterium]|nr:hypothetical protein [Bacteroidota bacterium]